MGRPFANPIEVLVLACLCLSTTSLAQMPPCAIQIPLRSGLENLNGTKILDTDSGVIVERGFRLFRFDGTEIVPIPTEPELSTIEDVQTTKAGLLVVAHLMDMNLFLNHPETLGEQPGTHLFRYNGSSVVPDSRGNLMKAVETIQNTSLGVLAGAGNGLFRYDGAGFMLVHGSERIGAVLSIKDTKAGVLLETATPVKDPAIGYNRNFFRYDGVSLTSIGEISAMSGNEDIYDTRAGALTFAGGKLFAFDGSKLQSIPGSDLVFDAEVVQDTRYGVLVGGALNGKGTRSLGRYDGLKIIPLPGSEDVAGSIQFRTQP